jgi:hypothetical protein
VEQKRSIEAHSRLLIHEELLREETFIRRKIGAPLTPASSFSSRPGTSTGISQNGAKPGVEPLFTHKKPNMSKVSFRKRIILHET